MRSKAGIICMLFGTALIFGALSLFIYNQREATEAEMVRVNLLPQLMEVIEENEEASTEPDTYAQPVGTPIHHRIGRFRLAVVHIGSPLE